MNSLRLFLFLGHLIAIISGCSFFSDSSGASSNTESKSDEIITLTADSINATLNFTHPYIHSYTDSTIVREGFENTCSKGGVFDSIWDVDKDYYEIRNDTFYS